MSAACRNLSLPRIDIPSGRNDLRRISLDDAAVFARHFRALPVPALPAADADDAPNDGRARRPRRSPPARARRGSPGLRSVRGQHVDVMDEAVDHGDGGHVVAEDLAPVLSTSVISGTRSSPASCSASTCLRGLEASAAPPRTAKSSPPTITRRPSIVPFPITNFAGTNDSSESIRPARAPISWKLPESSSRSIRSRTVR
jgi:hypothetical protein